MQANSLKSLLRVASPLISNTTKQSPRRPHLRSYLTSTSTVARPATANMTAATFKYIDPTSYVQSDEPFVKPWAKVDGPGYSFRLKDYERQVEDARGQPGFDTDTAGFAVYHAPAHEKSFTDETTIRTNYYPEVENLVRSKLSGVKKVVIFDHTIRRHQKASPRQPVQQVHVDQTPRAAETRVRRHLPPAEAEDLLKSRYQIINVWRPIENPASDFPLAVVDWRSTKPEELIKVDLLYPKRADGDDGDDRGKEVAPDPTSAESTDGYEVKGETFAVAPSDGHRFYYYKDMTPDEAMFIKCFDSRSEVNGGKKGVAAYTPHTAFVDPQTPPNSPGRQSIEVRCLVFYE